MSMANNIVIFTSKSDLDAKQNLLDFINFAESLEPLNEQMDYTSAYWKGAINFTKVGISSKDRTTAGLLDSSFIRFAKAYLLYSQTHNRTKTYNEMKAIRAVESVLLRLHGDVDVTKINMNILDKSAQLIIESYSQQAAYHGGSHLEKLKKFLISKKIISSFTWFNPIKRGEDTPDKVGEKAEAHRFKKLPDENALMAIAEIFSFGVESLSPRDIFTTSSIAILLAAPARGSELFYLKTDCIHEDTDRNGNKALGLKWYSGKGYGHEVEWIPNVMEDIVREAVNRLKLLSQAAREFAKQLELEKTKAVMPEGVSSFPYVNFVVGTDVKVKWSEALYSMFVQQLHSAKKTSSTKLWMPNIDTLNEDISPTKKLIKGDTKLSNTQSVFGRHKYPPYSLKTHQLRHLLTTIAKVNGMQTELLTKWSGRANEKHNRVYNHTTPEQYNQKLATITGKKVTNIDSFSLIEVFMPNSIQEINTNASLTLHQTEFGVCIQSYISNPCTKHRNCITCSEQVCVKGDEIKLERLRKRLSMEQSILAADMTAIAEGSIGADRHYNMRLETIRVCKELIDKLTDDTLADGALIKIASDYGMSNLDRALEINNKKQLPKIEKHTNTGASIIKKPQLSLRKLSLLRGG